MLRAAFPASLAAPCAAVIAEALGIGADEMGATERFLHLRRGFSDGPFVNIMNPTLEHGYDELLGAGNWTFDGSFGWWPVTLPGFGATTSVRDLGWHVDGDESFRHYVNRPEKGVVSLYLFSDVSESDGGTVVFPGSHRTVTRMIAAAEPHGLLWSDLTSRMPVPSLDGDIVEITGERGDVAFLHPYLVHATNRNAGGRPRFACNPHVDAVLRLDREPQALSLVERATVQALEQVP